MTAKPLTPARSPALSKNREGQEYTCKIYNGRVRIYISGRLFFCFNQLDFRGLYAYKDDTALYGLDIYLMDKIGGETTMEIYFKTKEAWLKTLDIMDTLV